MRRPGKVDHGTVSHERWVISYADFVTLLFAFFVVMFATANADKSKALVVSESVRDALSGTQPVKSKAAAKQKSPAPASTPNDTAANTDPQVLTELRPSLQLLKEQLNHEIVKGEVEVHMESRGLTISFKQAGFFDSGEANIKPAGIAVIGKAATAILKLPNQVRLEGHTDNVPIHNEHFENNWQLSSARSIAILSILNDRFAVPLKRLSVAGYADVAPVATNDTEQGRASNRRVDLVILSSIAAISESRKEIK